MEMFGDDVSIKPRAASYDEDPEFTADVEDELDQIDEEEEEVFSDERIEEHSEQADLFAPPSPPPMPYDPPTRLSEEPVPAPPAPPPPTPKKAVSKKVVKKAAKKVVKKAAKKTTLKK